MIESHDCTSISYFRHKVSLPEDENPFTGWTLISWNDWCRNMAILQLTNMVILQLKNMDSVGHCGT